MAPGPRREHRPAGGSSLDAKPRKRVRKPSPADVAALLDGGHRATSQQPAVQQLQRSAGNRATAELLTAQREVATPETKADPRAAISGLAQGLLGKGRR